MGHLIIAYDLLVILIGFSALSIAAFWAARTGEAYLRNFCILYSLFTAVLVIALLKKYLFLNLSNEGGLPWYILSGLNQIVSFGVIVATIHFFHDLYQIRLGRRLTLAFLLLLVVCNVVVFTPWGAVMDASGGKVIFGPGYRIATGCYIGSFAYALAVGFGFLRRIWSSNLRIFVAGLLVFGLVGFAESVVNFIAVLSHPYFLLSTESDFLVSSIPYALYGIFLLFYFLRFVIPSPGVQDALTADRVAAWGITGREREIILKVLQGKSNADIAGELFISLATVKTHLHNIYQKIGVDSRFDLIARVRDQQN